eukprot:jgi/Hompol1/1093/HPOL_005510-RA
MASTVSFSFSPSPSSSSSARAELEALSHFMVPPTVPPASPPARSLVFVDPDDAAAPFWWPAM